MAGEKFTPMSQMGPQTTPSQVDGQIEEQPQAPVQDTPDAGGLPAVTRTAPDMPQQATPPPNATNAQPAAPQQQPDKHSQMAGIFRNIAETLAGPSRNEYKVNPDGTVTETPIKRTGSQLATAIVAGALTGMFSGMAEHGPGATGRAFQRGAEAEQQNVIQPTEQANASDRAAARDNYNAQQNAVVIKARNLQNNLNNMMLARNIAMHDMDWQNTIIDRNKEFATALKDSGAVMDQGQRVDDQDLQKMIQDGRVDPTKSNAVMVGAEPSLDENGKPVLDDSGIPKTNHYWMVFDPSKKFTIPKNTLDRANYYGIPGVKGVDLSLTPMNAGTIHGLQVNVDRLDTLQRELEDYSKAFGDDKEGFKVDKDYVKSMYQKDPAGFMKALSAWERVEGKDVGKALETLTQSQNKDIAGYAGNIASWFGGRQRIEQLENIQKINLKQEESDIIEKREERKEGRKKADEEAQNNAVAPYLEAPDGWTDEDTQKTAAFQTASEAKAYLASKGAQIPDNFEALWKAANYKQDPKTFPQKIYKGVGGSLGMNQQTAATYISKFLNPEYADYDYAPRAQFVKELSSTTRGAGKTLYNLGTASQHIEQMMEAHKALKNGNLQFLNGLANNFGVAIGKDATTTFRNILDQVQHEVGNVVAGSNTLTVNDVQNMRHNLNDEFSDDQMKGVANGWLHLMKGRTDELNDRSKDLLKRDIHISPATKKTFNRFGLTVPGQDKIEPPPAQAQQKMQEGQPVTFSNGQTWVKKNGQVMQLAQ